MSASRRAEVADRKMRKCVLVGMGCLAGLIGVATWVPDQMLAGILFLFGVFASVSGFAVNFERWQEAMEEEGR